MYSLKKKEIANVDKLTITKVCIYDFTIRKGAKYATVMVDIDTHRIVDMINSCECDDVVNWLKEYLNLQVVSREGSITYKKAISEAHSNAIQVTDRFHLLKNLTMYSQNYLRKYLKPRIPIELPTKAQKESISSEINNKNITNDRFIKRES